MAQVVDKQKTQATQPSRNKTIIAVIISVLVIILGGLLLMSQLPPDCEKIRQSSAKDFQAGHYREAYNKLKPYVKPCSKSSNNPVLRFKFLHGLATAAYKAKDRKAATSYAKQADQLNRAMTVEQQDAAQKEAGDVGDILLDDYHYYPYPVKNVDEKTP